MTQSLEQMGGIAYLVFCALVADIGWRKGRGWFAGFLLSVFFTPLSIYLSGYCPGASNASTSSRTIRAMLSR
jgi:hypothetical protein